MFEVPSLVYAAAGLAVFAAALLPRLLIRAPVSMPMVFLGAGVVVFAVLGNLPDPDPLVHGDVAMYLSEVCVIVSLMGAGLSLDRPFGVRSWATTWRLLAVAMPLCLLGFALIGWWALGLGAAAAVLLAAALAPTDPVLASEVQVGEPAEAEEELGGEDEVRFGLTSEAGLNDGLAFPFVYLAIALSLVGTSPAAWLPQFIVVDLLWRIGVGCLVGYGVGRLLGLVFFRAPVKSLRLADYSEGFVALAATFLAYGVTQMVEGYGFVAVFVCAVTIRSREHTHGYHRILHSYIEQLERLLTVVLLVLLGGAVARGLLAGTTWAEVAVAFAFVLLIRPLSGWAALTRGRTGPWERAVISFFGVRGIGSLYYLAYGLSEGRFAAEAHTLWRLVALVVITSVVVHGITAGPVMNALDRARKRKAVRDTGSPGEASRTAV